MIRGKVSTAGAALTAPLSQRPCVFCDVPYLVFSEVSTTTGSLIEGSLLEGLLDNARSSGERTAVSPSEQHERRGQAFLVTDDSGTAAVEFHDVAEVSFLVDPVDVPQPSPSRC